MSGKWELDETGFIWEDQKHVICGNVSKIEDAQLIVNAPKMFKALKHLLYYDGSGKDLDDYFGAVFGENLGKKLANEIRSSVSDIEII